MNKLEQINKRKRQYGEMTQDDFYLIQSLKQIHNILDDPFPQDIYPQLSQLERNIAKMTVIDGMTAQEISDALGSPKGTVNTYLTMVYKAFGVRRQAWPKMVFDRIRKVLKDE